MDKSDLDRINELAHIARERELTEDEAAERSRLRAEFISEIRADLKSTLDNIEFVDEPLSDQGETNEKTGSQ